MKVIQDEFRTIEDAVDGVPADEPVFIIRATDPAAQQALRAYATLSMDLATRDREGMVEFNKHVEEMHRYAIEHPDLIRR